MGKKKPFIDKKNSSTYHLLYRSQRDVAGEDLGDSEQGARVILWPSPDNDKTTDRKVLLGSSGATTAEGGSSTNKLTLDSWKAQLSQAGLVDDYDYDQHLKPITGTGKFLDASGSKHANAMHDPRSKALQEVDEELELVKEVDRQLESIALNADCMDEDIAEALFGDFEEGDFEELNDEFVMDAAREPEPGEDDGKSGTFDFAAHVKHLMERARMESDETRQLATVHEYGTNDQAFFSKAKPLHGDNDDDSGYFDEDLLCESSTPGAAPKLNSSEEKALCVKFMETLAEYDSDELGDCNEEDIAGPRLLEGDKMIEDALDDFCQEKKDEIFMQGTRHYMEESGCRGSGFAALVGKRMIPIKDLQKQEEEGKIAETNVQPIQEVMVDANQILLEPLHAPPAEEVFIDGKSYYSEKIRNPWDCESILSTYSNLDNNPVTIGVGSGRRRRKQKKKNGDSISEEMEQQQYQQILLSEKTGLPLGVLGNRQGMDADIDDYDDGVGDDTMVSVNKGESRNKRETADEKKLRKAQVKKERQMARMQKKLMKDAFTNEFTKRANEVTADDVGGKSVFRF